MSKSVTINPVVFQDTTPEMVQAVIDNNWEIISDDHGGRRMDAIAVVELYSRATGECRYCAIRSSVDCLNMLTIREDFLPHLTSLSIGGNVRRLNFEEYNDNIIEVGVMSSVISRVWYHDGKMETFHHVNIPL